MIIIFVIIFFLYFILSGCQHFSDNTSYYKGNDKPNEICDTEISKTIENNETNIKSNEICYVKKPKKVKYQIIKMVGDGDCLYHSLSYKLDSTNHYIENTVLNFIENNPDYIIHDIKLQEWILYDTGLNMENYIKQLQKTELYPGPIEIQIFCKLFQKNVHIYETVKGKYVNTHSIYYDQTDKSTDNNLTVYYSPYHYDYIEIKN